MTVNISFLNQQILFDFVLGPEDEEFLHNPVHMSNRSCFFDLPYAIKDHIHPDVLAMSIILMVFPFVKKEIKLPFAVSKVFSQTFKDIFNFSIGPSDNSIQPRRVSKGRPGLSYSAGVDSTAALALMPKNTAVVFLDRLIPSFKKSMYDKSAALGTVKDVKKNYETYSVATNMEYMRSPIGFPVSNIGERSDIPLSSAVPIVLLADKLNIDSIAYGIVMESLYLVGHKKYNNFAKNNIFLDWKKLFEVVGIKLFFPTAGLSEVATSKISNSFALSKYVRSCMRGTQEEPCKKCIKCFRKLTLDKALVKEGVNFDDLMDNLQSKEVVRNLYSKIKHENVYRYIAEQLKPNEFTLALKKRIGIENEDTTWMEKWYPESLKLVPEKYHNDFLNNINKYLEYMNEKDISFVENWGVLSTSNSNQSILLEWQKYLSSQIEDQGVKVFLESLLSKQKLIKDISYKEWRKTI